MFSLLCTGRNVGSNSEILHILHLMVVNLSPTHRIKAKTKQH